MSLPLPAEHTWGFVVGRIIHATADTTADVDRLPEARAAKGSIRFEPRSKLSKVLTSPTAFVGYEVATATLNSLGELTDTEGQVGIWLISGVYGVSFSIEGVTIPSFEIEVTPAHTPETPLDLAIAAPYVAPTGTSVTTLLVPAGAFDGAGLGWGDGGLAWLPGAAAAATSAAAALGSEEGAEEAASLAAASATFSTASATASGSARDAAVAAQDGAESARDLAAASAAFASGSALVVLRSPDGNCWRGTITNTGVVTWTLIL